MDGRRAKVVPGCHQHRLGEVQKQPASGWPAIEQRAPEHAVAASHVEEAAYVGHGGLHEAQQDAELFSGQRDAAAHAGEIPLDDLIGAPDLVGCIHSSVGFGVPNSELRVSSSEFRVRRLRGPRHLGS